ncbi:glycosyltransferase family 2 protein [bacterium]|nr:glycosyltransferase family 2 protein [bacterium]
MKKNREKITVLINTLNEQDNIVDCIRSVEWADEILVVDMHSDDDTVKLAQKFGAKVLNFERVGYVEPARNFGIEKALNDWIFVVDADERIPGQLAQKVRDLVDGNEYDVCWVPEKNMVFGEWIQHGLLWPDYHPRLFRKGFIQWSSNVHDIPKPIGRETYLAAEQDLAIEHLSKSYATVSGFVDSYNRYSTFEADTLKRQGYKFRSRHYILVPVREFRSRFFKHKGYRDGHHGLRLALLFAFYKFLVIAKYVEKYNPTINNDKGLKKWQYLYRLLRDR